MGIQYKKDKILSFRVFGKKGGYYSDMKQKKGKDNKMTRQGTDGNRIAKKRLRKSIEASFAREELDEDKLDRSDQKKEVSK